MISIIDCLDTVTRGFKMMPHYRYSTTDDYVAGFYEHHFDGFLLDAVPLIKRLGWSSVVSGNALIRSNSSNYYELSAGISDIKIGALSLFRMDYVWSYDNSILQDRGFPALYDVVYFRGLFQVLRVGYDYTLGWIPFPMVYVLFFVVVQVIYQFLKFKGFRTSQGITAKVWSLIHPILSLAGAVIFFFYFLWGFNYQQPTLASQLELPTVQPDTLELYSEASLLLEEMTQIPTVGRVRVRELRPSGILLRISTAGVYIPFVCEGHIDAGLHATQYPFTMAHEMSHGYGIADEGTCNFTGVVACGSVP